MCWSGEASLLVAGAGFTGTLIAVKRREDKALWLPLGYFSVMELIQAATYPVLGQCDLLANQALTILAIIHIYLQTFFFNMVAMHFIPSSTRLRIARGVYAVCFIGTVIHLFRMFPFEWAGICVQGNEPICGPRCCSVFGNWHLAWEAPMNGLKWTSLGYYVPALLLPFLYGSWRFAIYQLLLGPVFSLLLTDNWNEWPAVWCLLSVGLLLLAVYSPLRKMLYVGQ